MGAIIPFFFTPPEDGRLQQQGANGLYKTAAAKKMTSLV